MEWECELAAYTHEVTKVSLGSSFGDLSQDLLPLWLDGKDQTSDKIHARIPKRSPLKTFNTHQLVIFQGRIRDMHEWHEFIKEIEDVAFSLSFMRSS